MPTDHGRAQERPKPPAASSPLRRGGFRSFLRQMTLLPASCRPLCRALTALAGLAPAVLTAQESRPEISVSAPLVALVHARLVDATSPGAREDQTLLIRDGKIADVGPFGKVSVPEGEMCIRDRGRGQSGMVRMSDLMFMGRRPRSRPPNAAPARGIGDRVRHLAAPTATPPEWPRSGACWQGTRPADGSSRGTSTRRRQRRPRTPPTGTQRRCSTTSRSA